MAAGRHRFARVLVLVGAGLLGVSRVKAEADGPDHYRVIGVAANDVLNLRAAPNPKAAKVGGIPPNSNCVRNLGCQGGLSFQEYTTLSTAHQKARLRQHPRWCRVEYRGITGWAAGRYLAEGGCP